MRPWVPLGCHLMLTGPVFPKCVVGQNPDYQFITRRLLFYNKLTKVMHVGKAWRGRLVNWVEKSSFEKICRLLEVSERECHCKVLLTLENISAVRQNSAPYNLPVIPHALPRDVVEGEHFVVADLRRLVSRGASSSRDSVVEASSPVQGVGSASRASTSSGGSSSLTPAPGRGTRSGHPLRPDPPPG